MESWLATSFGRVNDQESKHLSKKRRSGYEIPGRPGGGSAILGRLVYGPNPHMPGRSWAGWLLSDPYCDTSDQVRKHLFLSTSIS